MELNRFLKRLSSDTPTPGGGSAAALAGALSASLVAMVAGLSTRKGNLRKGRLEQIRKQAHLLQRRLLKAVDEDARSFDAVMKAFRLPKTTERERVRRTRAIRTAYQKATLPPQRVCQDAIQLLKYSHILVVKGNPNALSDAGVASFLADAALGGGLLNIGVNLGSVTDKRFLRRMHSLTERWAKERSRLMGAIMASLINTGSI